MNDPRGIRKRSLAGIRSKSKRASANDALKAISAISDGVITVDLKKQVTFINQAAETLTGWNYGEAVGRPRGEIFNVKDPTTKECTWNLIMAVLEDDERYSVLPNSVLVRKDGVEIPIEDSTSPIYDATGQVCGAAIIFRDMTLSRLILLKALHRAHHDPLTALPNRLVLDEQIKRAFAALKERQIAVAILFIDLDGFKQVNDTFGHAAGDHVLRTTAKRMNDCTRKSDTVSRVGGDEFVILMPDITNLGGVIRVAQKLILSMNEPILFEKALLRISISVGMATSDQPRARATSLIEDADLAMYHAKQAGGNRAEWFSSAMQKGLQQSGLLEDELNNALQRKEF